MESPLDAALLPLHHVDPQLDEGVKELSKEKVLAAINRFSEESRYQLIRRYCEGTYERLTEAQMTLLIECLPCVVCDNLAELLVFNSSPATWALVKAEWKVTNEFEQTIASCCNDYLDPIALGEEPTQENFEYVASCKALLASLPR